MTLARTFSADRLNRAANDAKVRPHLGLGEGPLDLTALVADPANVCFDGEHGGFLLHAIGPGVLEAHSMVTPEGRRALHRETRAILHYAFSTTDTRKVVTKVPACNAPADALALASGFREAFRCDDAWPGPDGLCGVSYRAVTVDDWINNDPTVKAEGEALAAALERVADPAQVRALGALASCLKASNPEKAVWLFNDRAALAGWPRASVASLHPPIIHLSNVALHFSGATIEVLKCQ